MVDRIDARRRRLNMQRVRSQDTRPEVQVRKVAHRLGYRFRLHRKDLPGTPDLVFPKMRKVIFVHGCFWHRHKGCIRTTTPATHTQFWKEKFEANQLRDRRVQFALESDGWSAAVIWECETKSTRALERQLITILGRRRHSPRRMWR
ncbi:MAG: DNA mismatch endonuclease Vsr [Proteobacteria bacterium]|nr:DNA mismatch endonuclease Vsr [Pseudomonadota bacterium]